MPLRVETSRSQVFEFPAANSDSGTSRLLGPDRGLAFSLGSSSSSRDDPGTASDSHARHSHAEEGAPLSAVHPFKLAQLRQQSNAGPGGHSHHGSSAPPGSRGPGTPAGQSSTGPSPHAVHLHSSPVMGLVEAAPGTRPTECKGSVAVKRA